MLIEQTNSSLLKVRQRRTSLSVSNGFLDILSGLSTSEPQRKAEPRRPKKLSTVDTTGTNPLENFVKSVLSTQNDQDGRDEDEMMS